MLLLSEVSGHAAVVQVAPGVASNLRHLRNRAIPVCPQAPADERKDHDAQDPRCVIGPARQAGKRPRERIEFPAAPVQDVRSGKHIQQRGGEAGQAQGEDDGETAQASGAEAPFVAARDVAAKAATP